MANSNKVVWSEGMFLRHQHFQQQERHIEQLISGCLSMAISYVWGFSKFKLDQQHLALGRIAISECTGIFSDGTPFDSRSDCAPPPFFEVPENYYNTILYLAIPLRGVDSLETSLNKGINLARYKAEEVMTLDNTSEEQNSVPIYVGRLSLRILTDKDDLSQFSTLPFAKVVERRADGSLVLDGKFIPPCLDLHIAPALISFLQELQGLLRNRGEDLAVRVTRPGVSGLSSMVDFLMLQLVNRYETFLLHLAEVPNLHPERLYSELLKLYGELVTFSSTKKRVTETFEYQHSNLTATFLPLFDHLRQMFSVVLEQAAIPLKLQMSKQGIRVVLLQDKSLLDTAKFILAVKADVGNEILRNRFPAQLKIGPIEKIRGLINIQLPGIPIEPLAVAPPEIPYHAGFTYFRLDSSSQFWKHMSSSTGFAFHVSGEFPGLEMEFWAVKGN